MALLARKKAPVVVGGFQVLDLVAKTEWATVYKGLDPVSGELVAVKVASPAITKSPVLLKRFTQEFAMIRGLQHPHLIRALRFAAEGDAPFMALEYVDGPSLGDRIAADKRLDEAEAVRIIRQIGEALHYAHQHRVIHRDVKPDNILLTREGVAKLADLGLAKDCESDDFLTRPSTGLGTPNFMAPEQFSDAKNADRRCDVYSLGATLYMAITGVVPFRAAGTMSILKKKLADDLVPPGELVKAVSPRVESAILRAVRSNSRARQSSCLDLIQDITEGAPDRDARPARRPGGRSASGTSRPRERRASLRYSSSRRGLCRPMTGSDGKQWEVTVHDVSADGIGLVLSRRFEPNSILRLDVAGEKGDGGRRLLVRVVRVIPLAGGRCLLGCVFSNRLDDEETDSMR